MIVLLKDDLMCATAWMTFLEVFCLPLVGVPFRAMDYFVTFFLPATVFFGPLRERALERVFWPRVGRP